MTFTVLCIKCQTRPYLVASAPFYPLVVEKQLLHFVHLHNRKGTWEAGNVKCFPLGVFFFFKKGPNAFSTFPKNTDYKVFLGVTWS